MFRTTLKTCAAMAVAAAAMTIATPAYADATLGTCNVADTSPIDAKFCVAVSGNANNGSPANTAAELNDMLDDLGTAAGEDFGDVDWDVVGGTKGFFSISDGDVLNFKETLFGEQIISIHFGGGKGGGETIMYLFDFGVDGRDWIDLGQGSYSNAVLITPPGSPPAVPEPATWAMMLLGFGAAGSALRRSRRKDAMLTQIA